MTQSRVRSPILKETKLVIAAADHTLPVENPHERLTPEWFSGRHGLFGEMFTEAVVIGRKIDETLARVR